MTLSDTLALAGGACGAVAAIGIIVLLVLELRQKPEPTTVPLEALQPRSYDLVANIGQYSVEVSSQYPLTVEDLEALRILLVRTHGEAVGNALAFALSEQLVETETAALDEDLRALAGGAL